MKERIAGGLVGLLVAVAALACADPLLAQSGPEPVLMDTAVWRGTLRIDGEEEVWPLPTRIIPQDSLATVGRRLLEHYLADGYLAVGLDSVGVRSTAAGAPGEASYFLDGGQRFVVGEVELEGVQALDRVRLSRSLETRTGRPFDPGLLEDDVQFILDEYDRGGLVLAQVRIGDLGFQADGETVRVDLSIRVDEGARLEVAGIMLPGAKRTGAGYVERVTGLRTGRPIPTYDPSEVRRKLLETGLFEEVGNATLSVDGDGRAVVVVPVREGAPGAFDAVVGYLPPRSGDGQGSVVGNVNILLRNLLGGGREFAFRFNRLPARVTEIDFRLADPYLLGSPVSVETGLEGYQRDSTYTRRSFRLETGYRIADGLEAVLTLSRELTRPGADTLVNIPRSNSLFAGLGFRYRRVDWPANPRRGWRLALNIERGRKLRSLRSVLVDPTVHSSEESISQQRLRLDSRFFVPVLERHVLAYGLEGNVLVSAVFDESDLFRLGGARSLRGYNEDQYRGHAAGRSLVEWRYLLDRSSFVFVFGDLGYVRTPARSRLLEASLRESPDSPGRAETRWLPGYGFGLQFGSEAGLFSVSLALNPDEGLGAKVHVGVLLGL